jgi:hypothetical protein
VTVWHSAAYSGLPDIAPCHWGWEKDVITRTLVPIELPPNTPLGRHGLLRTLCCIRDSAASYKTKRCSCHNNKSGCDTFYKSAEGDSEWNNRFIHNSAQDQDDDQSMRENTGDEGDNEVKASMISKSLLAWLHIYHIVSQHHYLTL